MKNVIIYAVMVALTAVAYSCKDDKESDDHGVIYGEMVVEMYRFNVEDTLLTAAEHEFTLQLEPIYATAEYPPSWTYYCISRWDDDKPEDEKWQTIIGVDSGSQEEIDCGWIKLNRVDNGNGTPDLKVTIQPNETYEYRAMQIMVSYTPPKYKNDRLIGSVVIAQKSAPDQEPFTVTARYKGETRSSTARLDMDEKMVYDDPSFAAFMEELSSKPEVETVVMDDEVVHFFDADDIAANPELQSFRQAVDASRPCELRPDLPVGVHSRANTGFEYMTSGAAGYYAMFDDNTFSDTHTFYNTGSFYEVHDIPYMSSLGLNDKVSSLAVAYNGSDRNVCAVLTVWQDSSFNHDDKNGSSHRVSFIASYYQPRLSRSNLKNVPFVSSGGSWNDCISSASFHFGNYGSYLKDY